MKTGDVSKLIYVYFIESKIIEVLVKSVMKTAVFGTL